jgi:hypothetical protein
MALQATICWSGALQRIVQCPITVGCTTTTTATEPRQALSGSPVRPPKLPLPVFSASVPGDSVAQPPYFRMDAPVDERASEDKPETGTENGA